MDGCEGLSVDGSLLRCRNRHRGLGDQHFVDARPSIATRLDEVTDQVRGHDRALQRQRVHAALDHPQPVVLELGLFNSCGLGPELAVLLPLLVAWRARRRGVVA